MSRKKNDKEFKQNENYSNQIKVSLFHQEKSITISVPCPCPALTLRQCLLASISVPPNKIAYFSSTTGDLLSDYKLQTSEGWIRSKASFKVVLKSTNFLNASGLSSYEMLKSIGVGGFSKVFLCRDRRDGEFYAAKFVEKRKLLGKEDLIENQRKVNEMVAFPFLVQMHEFFEVENYYVMIMDYCPGGELFHLQRQLLRFSEEEAKKYFIQVLLAIQYLHSKNIIYRDLKPENIMIDLRGHLRIADFGLAKVIKEKRFSYCGSLEYMSPEIVTREGHSFQVDYYCLGALLYEMVVGCPPFYHHNSSESETKGRILQDAVQFPQELGLSESIKDLIRRLLEKKPAERLGYLGGVKQIKCHSWVGWINKTDYLERKMKMPYPVNLDGFNFDPNDITSSANRVLHDYLNDARRCKEELCSKQEKLKRKEHARGDKKFCGTIKEKSRHKSPNAKQCLQAGKYKSQSYKGISKERQSPYRSQVKLLCKNSSFSIKHKKRNNSQPTLKVNRYDGIRHLYLGHSNQCSSKYLRFPTESYDSNPSDFKKSRRSYAKVDTQINAHPKQRELLKKRKAKEEYIFYRERRNI